ncbi:MAG: chorismate mutase [Proteobacteria bacterium]|nr:chorismate mutase [Pseudomonadota bacterium]
MDDQRKSTAENLTASLPELRQQVDKLDSELLKLLAERFKVTHQIGVLKQALLLPAADRAREAVQRDRIRSESESLGVNPDFAERIWRAIVDEVIQNHPGKSAE